MSRRKEEVVPLCNNDNDDNIKENEVSASVDRAAADVQSFTRNTEKQPIMFPNKQHDFSFDVSYCSFGNFSTKNALNRKEYYNREGEKVRPYVYRPDAAK
ncbi:hypothetical protein WN51_02541 [Melipona quadrifasciata]|uniref:Uncharacterized protein n=1 Tax=Melipona quadrifasciata TaxID=166423 RepID=A0A0M8ZSY4_9HYME|nr:hypothetical protein WN51_02541 [Melipona quadrifasciata]